MVAHFPHVALSFSGAFVAGVINSIAGGGTLVSFPVLIWLGLPPVSANATSTVAIWPGSVGGAWGYRREVATAERWLLALILPSAVGGVLGAVLLRWTSSATFAHLVPWLVLFATLLFMLQGPIHRHLKTSSSRSLTGAMCFQFFVALYGGYFGAGIGILMLAALSILGMADIHQMNGLKNIFALAINGVASVYFILAGMVYWPDVLTMAIGAIAGGYGCAGLARRMGRTTVRRIVIIIGFAMTLSLFLKHS